MGLSLNPFEVKVRLRPGSRTITGAPSDHTAGPLCYTIDDVDEYVVGFRYLYIRTRSGKTYSVPRDDIDDAERRRNGAWRPIPMRRAGDRRFDD